MDIDVTIKLEVEDAKPTRSYVREIIKRLYSFYSVRSDMEDVLENTEINNGFFIYHNKVKINDSFAKAKKFEIEHLSKLYPYVLFSRRRFRTTDTTWTGFPRTRNAYKIIDVDGHSVALVSMEGSIEVVPVFEVGALYSEYKKEYDDEFVWKDHIFSLTRDKENIMIKTDVGTEMVESEGKTAFEYGLSYFGLTENDLFKYE